MILFNPLKNPATQVVSYLLYRWWNWDLESLNSLPKGLTWWVAEHNLEYFDFDPVFLTTSRDVILFCGMQE